MSPAQGLDCSCRPSTEKGVRSKEPSEFSTKVPCWNCMIACGHDGFVGFETAL